MHVPRFLSDRACRCRFLDWGIILQDSNSKSLVFSAQGCLISLVLVLALHWQSVLRFRGQKMEDDGSSMRPGL